MGKYYKFVNGHTLLTEYSKELEAQKLTHFIARNNVCKNCGMVGHEVYEKECEYKQMQLIDKQLEKTMLSIDETERAVREIEQQREMKGWF